MNLKNQKTRSILAIAALATFASTLVGCSSETSEGQTLTIYSGRSEQFIAPFLDEFSTQTGIKLNIRYADSAALAAQILEEGDKSPADLFLSQDAGSLGAISAAGLLTKLDSELLNKVSAKYQSTSQDWVGVTGRARVFVYSPDRVSKLPTKIDDLLLPEWKSRLAIAPTNSSFQAFVTALIQTRGEAGAELWLNGLKVNSPKLYEKNSQIVEAVDAGQVDLGLVNHYYLWEVARALGRDIKAAIGFFQPGDLGNLVNVSGAGVLATAKNSDGAKKLIEFLLNRSTQEKFVSDTHEYSLALPKLQPESLPALADIKSPAVDLSTLADLKRTQNLLIKVGLL
jgi:iron(III) transport system substrate-binding protein